MAMWNVNSIQARLWACGRGDKFWHPGARLDQVPASPSPGI